MLYLFMSFVLQTALAKPNLAGDKVYMSLSRSGDNAEMQTGGEVMITRTEQLAINQLMKLIKTDGHKNESAPLWYRLAEHYVRRSKAGQHFEVVKRADTQVFQVVPAALQNVTQKSELSNAVKIYQKIEAKFPKYNKIDDVLFFHGFALQQLKSEEAAKAKYKALITSHPKSEHFCDGLLSLGEIYFSEKKHKLALDFYTQHLKTCSGDKSQIARYKYAWSQYNLGETDLAIDAMIALIKLQKSMSSPSFQLLQESYRDIALFYSDSSRSSSILADLGSISTTEELESTFERLGAALSRHAKWNLIIESLPAWHAKVANPEKTSGSLEYLVEAYFYSKDQSKFSTSLNQYVQVCQLSCAPKASTFIHKVLFENKATLVKNEDSLYQILNQYLKVETDLEKRLIAHKTLLQIEMKKKNSLKALEHSLIIAYRDKDESERKLHHKIAIQNSLESIEKKIPDLTDSSAFLIADFEATYGHSEESEKYLFDLANLAIKTTQNHQFASRLLSPVVQSPLRYSGKNRIEDLYIASLNEQKDYSTMSQALQKMLTRNDLATERKSQLLELKEFALYSAASSNSSQINSFALSTTTSKYRLQALKEIINKTSETNQTDEFRKSSLHFLQHYGSHPDSMQVFKAFAASHWNTKEVGLLHSSLLKVNPTESFLEEFNKTFLMTAFLTHDTQTLQRLKSVLTTQKSPLSKELQLIIATTEATVEDPVYLQAKDALAKNQMTQAFQLSKGLLKSAATQQLKAKARLIQSEVLIAEFKAQSTKTKAARFEQTLTIVVDKYEKAEKAIADTLAYRSPRESIQALQLRIALKDLYSEKMNSFPTPEGMAQADFQQIKDQLIATTVKFPEAQKSDLLSSQEIAKQLSFKDRVQMGLIKLTDINIDHVMTKRKT